MAKGKALHLGKRERKVGCYEMRPHTRGTAPGVACDEIRISFSLFTGRKVNKLNLPPAATVTFLEALRGGPYAEAQM